MNVLILGGTRFLGRHIASALRGRGHDVTLFNTGHHTANAPAGVAQVHGKRETDLSRLGEGPWDAVIDTCGYVPSQLETSTRYLRDKTGQYVFISSISALDLSGPSADENTPRLAMPHGASRTEMSPQTYGPLKAASELVVQSVFRHRALIVRPGLIVGPYDPTDRFTYWPARIARGGVVLAPAGPEYFVQFIDARDLAAWIALQVERANHGVFNVTGPPRTVRLGDVLQTAMRVANVYPEIRYADEYFLKEHGVGDWIDLPLFVATWSNAPAMTSINTKRARESGLHIRPLAQTVADTLVWSKGRGPRYEWKAGLLPEREAQVLSQLS